MKKNIFILFLLLFAGFSCIAQDFTKKHIIWGRGSERFIIFENRKLYIQEDDTLEYHYKIKNSSYLEHSDYYEKYEDLELQSEEINYDLSENPDDEGLRKEKENIEKKISELNEQKKVYDVTLIQRAFTLCEEVKLFQNTYQDNSKQEYIEYFDGSTYYKFSWKREDAYKNEEHQKLSELFRILMFFV